MKQTLSTLILLASIGTIVLVAANPKLAQQGAALVGLGMTEQEPMRSPHDEEDHLAKFLRQYPDNPYSTALNVPESPPSLPRPIVERPAPPIAGTTGFGFGTVTPEPTFPTVPPPPQPVAETKSILTESTVTTALPSPFPSPQPESASVPSAGPPVDSFAISVPGLARTTPAVEEFDAGFARSSQAPSNDYQTSNPITVLPPSESPPPVARQADLPPPPEQASWPSGTTPPDNEILTHQQPVLLQPEPPQPEPVPFQADQFSSDNWQTIPPPPQTGAADSVSFHVVPESVVARPEPRTESQFLVSPSVIIEEIPVHGAETVARIGTQVILMCDILPQLRRAGNRMVAEQMKNLPPDQQTGIPAEEKEAFVRQVITANYPSLLQEQIMLMLVFNDFIASKRKEEIEFFEKRMGEDFDQNDVPKMMKEFNVKNMAELKQYLERELGSSLERERILNIHAKIAQQWMMHSVGGIVDGECTYDEMLEYYTTNRAEFERNAKVRWRELVVLFDRPGGEQEAWKKIAWMGNQVAAGASFEQMAKENSDGFTASRGGLWDWTQPGSLTSEDIEKAVFTMPPNILSPIIKGPKGFHIVMVVEREEASVVPLLDAQVTIREKIKMQRRQRYQDEYFVELRRRYPVKILRETIDFNPTRRTVAESPAVPSIR